MYHVMDRPKDEVSNVDLCSCYRSESREDILEWVERNGANDSQYSIYDGTKTLSVTDFCSNI